MRFDIKKLLSDPKTRRELITKGVVATQAREGIDVTLEETERIYDEQKMAKCECGEEEDHVGWANCEDCDDRIWFCLYCNNILKGCSCGHCEMGATFIES